jgi:hypothetical protein
MGPLSTRVEKLFNRVEKLFSRVEKLFSRVEKPFNRVEKLFNRVGQYDVSNRCSKRHNNATIRDKVLIDIERG